MALDNSRHDLFKVKLLNFTDRQAEVLKKCIDTILSLPWGKRYEDTIDVENLGGIPYFILRSARPSTEGGYSNKFSDINDTGWTNWLVRKLQSLVIREKNANPKAGYVWDPACDKVLPGFGDIKISEMFDVARALQNMRYSWNYYSLKDSDRTGNLSRSQTIARDNAKCLELFGKPLAFVVRACHSNWDNKDDNGKYVTDHNAPIDPFRDSRGDQKFDTYTSAISYWIDEKNRSEEIINNKIKLIVDFYVDHPEFLTGEDLTAHYEPEDDRICREKFNGHSFDEVKEICVADWENTHNREEPYYGGGWNPFYDDDGNGPFSSFDEIKGFWGDQEYNDDDIYDTILEIVEYHDDYNREQRETEPELPEPEEEAQEEEQRPFEIHDIEVHDEIPEEPEEEPEIEQEHELEEPEEAPAAEAPAYSAQVGDIIEIQEGEYHRYLKVISINGTNLTFCWVNADDYHGNETVWPAGNNTNYRVASWNSEACSDITLHKWRDGQLLESFIDAMNLSQAENEREARRTVTIVWDPTKHKLRAQANDGVHGVHWVMFPNSLREREGQKYKVNGLNWTGTHYTVMGSITPVYESFSAAMNEEAPTDWDLKVYGNDVVDVENGVEAEDSNGLYISFDKVTRADGTVDIYGSYNNTNNAEGPDTEFEVHFDNEEEYQEFLSQDQFFDY